MGPDADDSNPTPLPQGSRLSHFRIDDVLGIGGFGITYLVSDARGNLFAAKEFVPHGYAARVGVTVLPNGEKAKEGFYDCFERFKAEADTLRLISKDQSIFGKFPHFISYFEDNGTAYIIMDYIIGTKFSDIISGNRHGITYDKLVKISNSLIECMALLHEKGIFHRDINPRNIIIKENGSAVIIDLGSARKIGESRKFTEIFSRYESPIEQIDGENQNVFSDIYSLGATLYQAIGGTIVPSNLRRLHVESGTPDPLKAAAIIGAGKYPLEFLDAIDQSLAVRPDGRPQSVDEFRRILKGVKSEQPTDRKGRWEPAPSNRLPMTDERSTGALRAMLFADTASLPTIKIYHKMLNPSGGKSSRDAAPSLTDFQDNRAPESTNSTAVKLSEDIIEEKLVSAPGANQEKRQPDTLTRGPWGTSLGAGAVVLVLILVLWKYAIPGHENAAPIETPKPPETITPLPPNDANGITSPLEHRPINSQNEPSLKGSSAATTELTGANLNAAPTQSEPPSPSMPVQAVQNPASPSGPTAAKSQAVELPKKDGPLQAAEPTIPSKLPQSFPSSLPSSDPAAQSCGCGVDQSPQDDDDPDEAPSPSPEQTSSSQVDFTKAGVHVRITKIVEDSKSILFTGSASIVSKTISEKPKLEIDFLDKGANIIEKNEYSLSLSGLGIGDQLPFVVRTKSNPNGVYSFSFDLR